MSLKNTNVDSTSVSTTNYTVHTNKPIGMNGKFVKHYIVDCDIGMNCVFIDCKLTDCDIGMKCVFIDCEITDCDIGMKCVFNDCKITDCTVDTNYLFANCVLTNNSIIDANNTGVDDGFDDGFDDEDELVERLKSRIALGERNYRLSEDPEHPYLRQFTKWMDIYGYQKRTS